MKKKRILIFSFMVMGMLFMLTFSCKNDETPAPELLPVLTTNAVSDIMATSATSGGNITSDGGATVTARGVCWSLGQTPTIADSKTNVGTGAGTFTSTITGLIPNTAYFVRAYATNIAGTGYGSAFSFTTTEAFEPIVMTETITDITQTSSTCGGQITYDGGAPITERGVCWSTGQTPTVIDSKTVDGSGEGSFASAIIGLNPYTQYYVRAYATNGYFTGYGSILSFSTVGPTVTDIDGNVYNTILIGTQTWMVENLKTTKYRNGDVIPNITDNNEWSNTSTGAYCDYQNSPSNSATYGRLYNWFAVNDNRNIAPNGWHVPSDAEWRTLTNYLGGENVAGGKLKETGTTHWHSPNTGATNESGFTGLPAGSRNSGGGFLYLDTHAMLWSSTEFNASDAKRRDMNYESIHVASNRYTKTGGNSVRCIKDN